MTRKIPFSPPFIDDDVKREVLEALNSDWIIISVSGNSTAMYKMIKDFSNPLNVWLRGTV